MRGEVVRGQGPPERNAQRRGGRGRMIPVEPNPPYDGQFTFVRLRYGPPTNYVSQSIPWSHDYPNGERHFMKILNELTMMRPHLEETSILGFDDPEVFKYPLAYMAEPGFLQLSEAEVAGFSAYLRKGGFVIFDDFSPWRGGWEPFEAQMLRVLPGARFVDLDASHPIFHSFFEIDDLSIVPQNYDQRSAGVPRHFRRQRSGEAPAGHDQLQHRHFRVLGVFRYRLEADQRKQRSV